jgi:hypothetical protein
MTENQSINRVRHSNASVPSMGLSIRTQNQSGLQSQPDYLRAITDTIDKMQNKVNSLLL